MPKVTPNKIDAAISNETIARAREIASHYTVIVQPGENGRYYGRSLEMTGVFDYGLTLLECTEKTYNALVFAVATLLEQGLSPPRPSSAGIRDSQINIRVSSYEKFFLEAAAERAGARGTGDYVRTAAIERANSEFKTICSNGRTREITDQLVILACQDPEYLKDLFDCALDFLDQMIDRNSKDGTTEAFRKRAMIRILDDPLTLGYARKFVESDGSEGVVYEDLLKPLRGISHPARALRARLRQISGVSQEGL